MENILTVKHLNKKFANGKHALQDINLEVKKGEMVAILGASGSGKSTLLNHIAGLMVGDKESESCIMVNGKNIQQYGKLNHKARKVRTEIGFIFQQFNLVSRLPVLINVLVGQLYRTPFWRSLLGLFTSSEKLLAYEALQRVGIGECSAQRASTLSGGQQQRAAIARTLVQKAQIILADEPIASLDPESSRKVMEILAKINREDRCTVLVSLHQVDIAMKYCSRVVALNKGKVVFDGPSSALTTSLLQELYGVQVDEILKVVPQSTTESQQNTVWDHSVAQIA